MSMQLGKKSILNLRGGYHTMYFNVRMSEKKIEMIYCPQKITKMRFEESTWRTNG